MRIEICGGIASGKTTTLANVLGQTGYTPILEDFQSNPFWKSFYADPEKVAFETEITFLLQHYHGIKQAQIRDHAFACDHSPLLDLAYARVTLPPIRLSIFDRILDEVYSELGLPDILVYLRCDAKTELERVYERQRDPEQSIGVNYLRSLNASLEALIDEQRTTMKVVELDSHLIDFATSESGKAYARSKIVGS